MKTKVVADKIISLRISQLDKHHATAFTAMQYDLSLFSNNL